jgi:Raf kinase inhibitor-like YbhB/YbcL family protein
MSRVLAFLAFCLAATTAHAEGFRLRVDGADARGRLPTRFAYGHDGCPGRNDRPDLHWSDPPKGTRSFAVSVFDPDAPTGHGWWHWFVLNLPAGSRGIAGNAALPAGAVELRNDYGETGWGGPCPPPGPAHRYVFTVYALDVEALDVTASTTADDAQTAARAHALGQAQVTLTFGR